MRVNATLVLFLFAFMSLAAETVAQPYLTLNKRAVTLDEVFREIKRQTDHRVFYSTKLVDDKRTIDAGFNQTDIRDVLSECLKGLPLTFAIREKTVVIKEAKASHGSDAMLRVSENGSLLILALPEVRGKVIDSLGNPLSGASVRVLDAAGKRTALQTQAGHNGEFVLNNVPDDAMLEVSFIGYLSQVIKAKPQVGTVVLRLAPSSLEEVEINAGYWKVNDKLNTGNISRVSGETIRQQPVIDPMLGLAGRVAGLQVTQQSGFPGAYHAMRIRGNNSLANGNDPLFLIDGVPFTPSQLSDRTIGNTAARLSPFAMINPEDIESIEILKDADATAIYGSRGANGVILITTKKGSVGQTQFNLNANTGFGSVTGMMDMLNTEQYLEMRREAFANDGVTNYPASAYDVNGTWDQERYTDWQDFFIGNTARQHRVQGHISGGSAQTQFMLGGGYSKESTVFPGVNYSRSRSGSITLNHKSTDQKFEVSIAARYLNRFTNQPQFDFSTGEFLVIAPNAPALYDESGNFNWENETWNNPMATAELRAKITSNNLLTNGIISYQFIPELKTQVNLGYNYLTTDQSNINPMKAYRPSWSTFPSIRSNSKADNDIRTWIVEPQLDFNKQYGGDILSVTVGATFQETDQYTLVQYAYDFADDALIENLMAAANILITNNTQTKYRYAALFGRINYNWKDKYLINVVARRDGTSRFASDRKYGNFASVGGAWIFSNERLLRNTMLSYGKLRASYGITGNDQIGDYQYLSTYSSYPYPYLGATGLYPTRLYSAEYGWESVRKIEAVLDLGFWNDRVRLSAVAYRNRTGNQLVGYSLPTMTGYSSIQANLPAKLQNSGVELELYTVNVANGGLNWNTSFNLTIPNNKLVDFPDIEKSSYQSSYEIGQPTSRQRLYRWQGIDPQTGIHTFEDVNGDGQITSPDDLQWLVNTASRLYGGVSNSFSFKGFQLDIFFHFVKRIGELPLSGAGTFANQPEWVMARWQQIGDVTDIGKFTQAGPARAELSRASSSDWGYGDASFIRLKNLALSYQLPQNILQSLSIKQCRVYTQCQNLFTITNYPGMDPETLRFGLPPIKMITAGINLTL